MATRAEVIQHIRGYSDVEEIDSGWFQVEFDLDNGRSQNLFMNVTDHLLVMISPFAMQDEITASKAFSFATVFGIALVEDMYAIRNVSLIEDLDESEITNMAMLIAARADEFEERIGGDGF